jgi:hypothetical protein
MKLARAQRHPPLKEASGREVSRQGSWVDWGLLGDQGSSDLDGLLIGPVGFAIRVLRCFRISCYKLCMVRDSKLTIIMYLDSM